MAIQHHKNIRKIKEYKRPHLKSVQRLKLIGIFLPLCVYLLHIQKAVAFVTVTNYSISNIDGM